MAHNRTVRAVVPNMWVVAPWWVAMVPQVGPQEHFQNSLIFVEAFVDLKVGPELEKVGNSSVREIMAVKKYHIAVFKYLWVDYSFNST